MAGPTELLTKTFPDAELVGSSVGKSKFSPKRRMPVDHTRFGDLEIAIDVERAKGCSHPVQLTGSVEVTDGRTEDVIHEWSSERDESNGVAYVPCRTRRASRCPSCSALYQGDAYRLILGGLKPGLVFDESITGCPAWFVTFTAPSFGAVHGASDGHCHARRGGQRCPHGNDLACWKTHSDDDQIVGQAICTQCFDYEGAVMWNAHAGALWRTTRITMERALAKLLGVSVKEMKHQICRIQYVKIAEFQKRGLVHFHAAIRLDGPDGQVPDVSEQTLLEAISIAHKQADVGGPQGQRICWGQQMKALAIGDSTNRTQIATYLAKYATKGSDAKGLLDSRVQYEAQIDLLPVNDHQRLLIRTSWELTDRHPELKTANWAHQFGYRGHFLTKGRGWSTTFKALRKKRSDFNAELQRQSWQALSPQAQLVITSKWEYAGCGYRTPREAHIAALMQASRTTATTAEEAA